jgi:hypothetical protein
VRGRKSSPKTGLQVVLKFAKYVNKNPTVKNIIKNK